MKTQVILETRNICIICCPLEPTYDHNAEVFLTDIGLINIFSPICKEGIWDNQQIQLEDKLSLLFCILVCEPLEVVPFPPLLGDGHLFAWGHLIWRN